MTIRITKPEDAALWLEQMAREGHAEAVISRMASRVRADMAEVRKLRDEAKARGDRLALAMLDMSDNAIAEMFSHFANGGTN